MKGRKASARRIALGSARFFLVVLGLGMWQSAEAQTVTRPFSDLGRYLEAGDTVFVVERARGETRGKVERLSPASLVLQVDGAEREFRMEEVGWVDRVPDPVWDGALWGGVFGYVSTLGLGGLFCASYPGTQASDCVGFLTSGGAQRLAVKFAGIYAGLGLLADVSKRERWLVYGTRPVAARTQVRAPRAVTALEDLWSRVRPGDTVYVQETSGREIKGTFSRASASSLTVLADKQPREIPVDQVRQVSRRTSQFVRGMVAGGVVGAVYGGANPARYSTRGETAVAGAALGWAVGTIIGGVVPRRTRVYGTDSPPTVGITPVLAPSQTGVRLSVRF